MILAIALILLMTVFLVFALTVLFGAPYLPTLRKDRQTALELLDLKPGQTLYDLGSGDGSLLLEAARSGLKAVGYELNPFLAVISRWRTRRYRGQARVVWGNYWRADFSQADGIFIFQLDKYMARIDKKIKREADGKKIKLVSHAFAVPGKRPFRKIGSLFLYHYD